MNNGFTAATDTIDTRGTYLASCNNYASTLTMLEDFYLTFDFNQPTTINALYVWNYVYYNNTLGSASPANGVKDYTLTFYSGIGGTGSVIGTVFVGTLAKALFNDVNPAQIVPLPVGYANVRSVVMHVTSGYGGTNFTGMDELAFSIATPVETPLK